MKLYKQRLHKHLLKTFDDAEKCQRYIRSLSSHDRLILIVSGRLGSEVVPAVHHLRQLSVIYVYCFDKKKHKQWTSAFSKIKGVITNLDKLVDQVQSHYAKEQQSKVDEPVLINIFKSDLGHERSMTGLNGQFIYSQLLIDCFLRMKPVGDEIAELVSHCSEYYRDNKAQLKILKEFQQTYSSKKSVWWYTRNSFLYRLLNKSLRMQNISQLFLFRFIICDLRKQLEKYRCTVPVRLYRGQLMSKEELGVLQDSVGGYISINSFLSTSLDREIARSFLCEPNELERVLFQIDADPRLVNIKPFADITGLSDFTQEKEVLMMIGCIFRLLNISCDNDNIWIVSMELCSDDNHSFKPIFDYLKNDYAEGDGQISILPFCTILMEMGKLDEAEHYFLRLLKELPKDHEDVHRCCFLLGIVLTKKGDYDSSLHWHHRALEVREQLGKGNELDQAHSYNCIGNIYRKRGKYWKALNIFQNALDIYKRVLGDGHIDLTKCLANIGNVYQRLDNYSKALEYHLETLSIREKHLPSGHSYIGVSHYNIATAYRYLGKSKLALEHANKSLEISQKSLPPNHPNIAWAIENIGYVHEDTGHLDKALSCLKKAAAIYRETLPSTHQYIIDVERNIQRVSSALN
ncbi:unnamed protein product [Adineta ricciae]|uniref:Uncharacterized protein n=1 Tax=Adineta ricciae TaxID=249248 RepID=A0A815WCZ7_ADIRI|nr:unnamed protein product [Adineta ricciae]CAF1541928.1 unnamed protein product [Adineta ricciae]